jgi:Dolichyl-phosphate-mannose-protein mannosyltransferase
MDLSSLAQRTRSEERSENQAQPSKVAPWRNRVAYAIQALAIAVSISIWFRAIHAPLWQDETGSYFGISGGFWRIPFRQDGLSFPAYSYILWLWTRLFGTGEIAMRLLSVMAMLGAVYLLYLAARELFERNVAIIAVVVFCLHPIVIFASIDIRPYAFAVLVTNAAIFLLLRLRRSDSYRMAVLFGLAAGCIMWFHLLFAVILPALVVCFFAVKWSNGRAQWKQFGIALTAFSLALLPVVPLCLSVLRTRGTHVWDTAPAWNDLVWTLIPGPWLFGLFLCAAIAVFFISASKAKFEVQSSGSAGLQGIVCFSLAFIPLLILFGISALTPIHMFNFPHRLVAIPGTALCWAYLARNLRFRLPQSIFCVLFVLAAAIPWLLSPISRHHGDTWKYALQAIEENARVDNTPVLMFSTFPESDYMRMPVNSARESRVFAPLSYYKLTVPVIPLPQDVNRETVRVSSWFLKQAAAKHERFLAAAYFRSRDSLDWLRQRAAAHFSVRELGTFDRVEVLEFRPRN